MTTYTFYVDCCRPYSRSTRSAQSHLVFNSLTVYRQRQMVYLKLKFICLVGFKSCPGVVYLYITYESKFPPRMLLYIVHQKLSMCIENLYVGFHILLKTFSSH